MAKEEQRDVSEEGGKPKKKKLWLFMALGLLVVSAGAGGGIYYYLQSTAPQGKAKAKVEQGPPVYVKLEPMVVNLDSDLEAHYLQVSMELKTFDPKVAEQITLNMPEIRDGILTLLASQDPDTVTAPEDREKLRQSVMTLVNKILKRNKEGHEKAGDAPVVGVYFTAFVMQ